MVGGLISIVGDASIIAGTWVLMGQYTKIESMPFALHAQLQQLHPALAILLPVGIVCSLVGRVRFVWYAQQKLKAGLVALLSLGRIPLFEGLACIGAFAFVYPLLTKSELIGMLIWITITMLLGLALLSLCHFINKK
jgi:hypothetical protein